MSRPPAPVLSAPAATGSRIRERRLGLGIAQARLAETSGISASYLNLIEHNRRAIGGRLLIRIAAALDTEPQRLARGADTALVEALHAAAAAAAEAGAESDRAAELAERFPGWARLLARQAAQIGTLAQTVQALEDRMTHDPALSGALHEVLSTVTAIASASAILGDGAGVEPGWQARFLRNIREDGERLAAAATGLAARLGPPETAAAPTAPQEEVEGWLAARQHHFPELERALPASTESILRGAGAPQGRAARHLAARHLERYRADAAAIPLARLARALAEEGASRGAEPDRIARRFGTDLATAMRRIASLPDGALPGGAGLVICDGAGAILHRRPLDGFPLPSLGAGCALLPLFEALSRPAAPVRALLEAPGAVARRFRAFAAAAASAPPGFAGPPLLEATMLVLPAEREPERPGAAPEAPRPIGPTCRLCPRAACPARREPPIL